MGVPDRELFGDGFFEMSDQFVEFVGIDALRLGVGTKVNEDGIELEFVIFLEIDLFVDVNLRAWVEPRRVGSPAGGSSTLRNDPVAW